MALASFRCSGPYSNGIISQCTYLLPIRRAASSETERMEFAAYFRLLAAAGCEVLVVDGSPSMVFAENARHWRDLCRHVPVDTQYGYLNGKVNGIHTGVALAHHEAIILADDDIRYTVEDVGQMAALLQRYDMVRPQNFLSPLPWWAKMEAARMLLNRAVLTTGDYPGTCGIRKSAMLRVGHFDGDVLFDNEEIVRHFAISGAQILYATDFFIRKRPPTLRKWKEQRPRQAYEDFVMKTKSTFFFLLLPVLFLIRVLIGVRALAWLSGGLSLGAVALANGGRHGAAKKFFPWSVCFFAPLWVLERALSVYWALGWKCLRGGYPFGDRLLKKGTGRDWIGGGKIAANVKERS